MGLMATGAVAGLYAFTMAPMAFVQAGWTKELEAPEFRIDSIAPRTTELLWQHGDWGFEAADAETAIQIAENMSDTSDATYASDATYIFPLAQYNGSYCESGRVTGGFGSKAYGNGTGFPGTKGGFVKEIDDAVWRISKQASKSSNSGSDGINGCYMESFLRADPMVVEWDAMLSSKTTLENGTYVKGAHMRFGATSTADKVTSTVADVYFDEDGYIKLDNGYGTSPTVGPAYQMNVWYRLKLYIDWSTVPAGLALMVDDGTGFVYAGSNEAYCTYCRYFKAIYMYNDDIDAIMYVDDLRLYDVENMTVTMKTKTSGYVGYDDYDPELASIFMVYSTGNLTHAAPSIDDEACDLTKPFKEVCATNCFRTWNTSATFALERTTHFKARACAFTNYSNGTEADYDASSQISSISYNLGTAMPEIITADFVGGNDATDDGANWNTHPPGMAEDDVKYDTTGLSQFNLGLYSSDSEQKLHYTLVESLDIGSTEVAKYFHKSGSNECDGERRVECVYGTDVSDAENLCVKMNTHVLGLATEKGKWPSRVRISDKYWIELMPVEFKMEKVILTHLAFVDVTVISRSMGSYVVYTLGDGTQPDPTCSMAETCNPDKTTSSSAPDCTDDELVYGFPYPTVRHIQFSGNETRVGKNILCDEKDEPTKGIITLTAEDYHSFAAIACRNGNEDSSVVWEHVEVMERMYYWVGFIGFYFALFFAFYYVNKVCQFYTWIKIIDIKLNNGRCIAYLSKAEKTTQTLRRKTVGLSNRSLGDETMPRGSSGLDSTALSGLEQMGGLATAEEKDAGERLLGSLGSKEDSLRSPKGTVRDDALATKNDMTTIL